MLDLVGRPWYASSAWRMEKENVAERNIRSLAVYLRVSAIKMPRARGKGTRQKGEGGGWRGIGEKS